MLPAIAVRRAAMRNGEKHADDRGKHDQRDHAWLGQLKVLAKSEGRHRRMDS